MTMISSYFASVGVGVDKRGLKNVDSYLKKVENKIKGFQKRIGKTSSVNIFVNLDQDRLSRQLRRAVSAASRGLTLRLTKVEISRATLSNAINKAMMKKSPAQSLIRIDAQLSQASLVHMRRQVTSYLKNINIGATITPRGGRVPSSGRGHSGVGGNPAAYRTRDRGGLMAGANPMLAGGMVGSMMRFGPYSLPFVAGAYGLNALANKAQTLESQQLLLNVSSQDANISKSQQEYLSRLGDRLGATTESMTPFFAQLVAGSRGTAMEKSLETGFSQFMDYASVVGLDNQQKEGALRAISQMLAKRRVQSEELRQQLAEHGMPMAVQIMADAVTGDGTRGSGDVAKLQKMMEMGQVDSIEALPKFFEALGREAAPWLQDYYKTISHTRGLSSKSQEDWMKEFLSGGGAVGVPTFFKTFAQLMKDSVQYASTIGNIFERASYVLSAAMLAPGEIFSYLRGDAGKGNFLTELFGPSSGSKLFQGVIDSFERFTTILSEQLDKTGSNFSALGSILSGIDTILAGVVEAITDAFEVWTAIQTGSLSNIIHASERTKQRKLAKETADFEADAQEADARAAGLNNFVVPQRDRSRRAKEIFSVWDKNNPRPGESGESTGIMDTLVNPHGLGESAGRSIRQNMETYKDDYMGFNPVALATEAINSVRSKFSSITQTPHTPIPLPTPRGNYSIDLGKLGLDSFGMLDRATGNGQSHFMMTAPPVAPTIYQNNPITLTINQAQDLDENKISSLIERKVRDANEDMLNQAGVAFPRTVT